MSAHILIITFAKEVMFSPPSVRLFVICLSDSRITQKRFQAIVIKHTLLLCEKPILKVVEWQPLWISVII